MTDTVLTPEQTLAELMAAGHTREQAQHILDHDYITVRVRDREAEGPWGIGRTHPIVRPVTISAYCPSCGRRRGEPRNLNQHEDGAWYASDVWDNPCGHLDTYRAVIAEARSLSKVLGFLDSRTVF